LDLRCFVSIGLPEDIKDNIITLTEGLRNHGADIKWIRSVNLHLTLKFLGQVPEQGISDISRALDEALAQSKDFMIKFKGLGVFPDIRRPRVIWVAVDEPGRLEALQKDIESCLVRLGSKQDERPYTAHLTLGRLRSQKGFKPVSKELVTMEGTFFGEFRAGLVKLMKSEFLPSGVVHTELSGHPFGG
jgi:2'-5' RNA ligase